jgi:hypothetical protein
MRLASMIESLSRPTNVVKYMTFVCQASRVVSTAYTASPCADAIQVRMLSFDSVGIFSRRVLLGPSTGCLKALHLARLPCSPSFLLSSHLLAHLSRQFLVHLALWLLQRRTARTNTVRSRRGGGWGKGFCLHAGLGRRSGHLHI